MARLEAPAENGTERHGNPPKSSANCQHDWLVNAATAMDEAHLIRGTPRCRSMPGCALNSPCATIPTRRAGGSSNLPDRDGRTAVHHAVLSENIDTLAILLKEDRVGAVLGCSTRVRY